MKVVQALHRGAQELLGNCRSKELLRQSGNAHKGSAIGVRAKGEDTTSPSYEFARRIKNDWIRVGAKDFMKYLSKTSGIDYLSKSKQFIAEYDPETETLIVVVDEDHLK